MKHITIGILAHVDAGKTTLSECMLYLSGQIRKLGRVDHKDAFLDTYELERERGITIFSKQAELKMGNLGITLLDTPGHVDFSAEMERTLQVLDYAILVINGADGVQGHTRTLWRLLKRYQIPTFIFINKMDQVGTDKAKVLADLQNRLDEGCIDFSEITEETYDSLAMCDEKAMEEYLESEKIEEDTIAEMIGNRKVYPCYFGSALKMEGVQEFMDGMTGYVEKNEQINSTDTNTSNFGAKVFKISRDPVGSRLTYLKVTSGTLKVKDTLTGIAGKQQSKKESDLAQDRSETVMNSWEEKVNQIRIYSGEKYTTPAQVQAGEVCAVTGLTKTYPGQGLGTQAGTVVPFLEPVLTYCIELPAGCDASVFLPKLRELEEEEPQLHIVWNEKLQQIYVQVMGEVQIEILKSLIQERFGVSVEFGTGSIVYKETIQNTVEGVGHFEPLRHYAEVHLLLEPLPRGSGLVFAADCSEEQLDKNWQRLVLTHLYEKEHLGVLTGSVITDMKITLKAGRAHQKHTEGGDFRQATYRAVRQGLMQAESVLLEPYYEFRLEIPETAVGRAMTDIERMCGTFALQQTHEAGMAVITGEAPVSTMKDYYKEVVAYSKGTGRLFCNLKGYEVCHNQNEVLKTCGYIAERDLDNPADSVFCAHGSGFVVGWQEVPEYMHLESILKEKRKDEMQPQKAAARSVSDEWIGTEEIDEILRQTYYANKRDKSMPRTGTKKRTITRVDTLPKTSGMTVRSYDQPAQKEYLLVDGYNIIFAWQELKELAAVNIDSARGRLLDILCNYQGSRQCELIVVFDAYRVKGHVTEFTDYYNIHVVYTKEAETADAYIEKFAHENGKKYKVTVATSDGLEQVIIRGQGCLLMSAREFEAEVKAREQHIRENYLTP